jgi:hypothetical protein
MPKSLLWVYLFNACWNRLVLSERHLIVVRIFTKPKIRSFEGCDSTRSVSTDRTLRRCETIRLTGISMFIIIISKTFVAVRIRGIQTDRLIVKLMWSDAHTCPLCRSRARSFAASFEPAFGPKRSFLGTSVVSNPSSIPWTPSCTCDNRIGLLV